MKLFALIIVTALTFQPFTTMAVSKPAKKKIVKKKKQGVLMPYTRAFDNDPVCKRAYHYFIREIKKRVKVKYRHWAKTKMSPDLVRNFFSDSDNKHWGKYIQDLKSFHVEAYKRGLNAFFLMSCKKQAEKEHQIHFLLYLVQNPNKVADKNDFLTSRKYIEINIGKNLSVNEQISIFMVSAKQLILDGANTGSVLYKWVKDPDNYDLKFWGGVAAEISNIQFFTQSIFFRFSHYRYGYTFAFNFAGINNNTHIGFSTTYDYLLFGKYQHANYHIVARSGFGGYVQNVFLNSADENDVVLQLGAFLGARLGYIFNNISLSLGFGLSIGMQNLFGNVRYGSEFQTNISVSIFR